MKQERERGFWSIQTKLSLTYLLIILIVAAISMGFIALFTDGFVMNDTRKKLKEDAEVLAEYHASNNDYTSEALDVMYRKIIDNNFSILIYTRDKQPFSGKNLDYIRALAGDQYQTAYLDKIAAGLDSDGSDILRVGSTRVMVYTQTVRSNTSPIIYGYVVLSAPLQNFGLNNVVFVLYLCAIFMASLFAMIVAAAIAGGMSSDIKHLTRRAEQLAKRNFNADTVVIDSHDEVEELAVSIEYMAQSIQEYDLSQKVFLQNASHELRTPLMSIRGYVEGIKDGIFDDTPDACDLVLGQVSRLEKLVNDVMYLSKIEASDGMVKLTPVLIQDIVDESVSRVAGIVAAGSIHIEVLHVDEMMINADCDLLSTAITNVLSNCMRFAKSRITLETFVHKGGLVIRITDDGPGINEGDLPHMFDRFYKGKNGKHGLGLAIAKAIAEQHGGTVNAYNKQAYPEHFHNQTGAVFDLHLPLPKKESPDKKKTKQGKGGKDEQHLA